jgi:predicted DNA-binding transcriptional regulator YafY
VPLIKERHWHGSQQIEDLPDGGCRLTLWVRDWREMQPWIRSWGGQVVVEAPAELRTEIAADAQKVAVLYDSPVRVPQKE